MRKDRDGAGPSNGPTAAIRGAAMLADPKPARRVKAPRLVSMFWLTHPWCEVCQQNAATSPPHHVLFRSQSGDDTDGNLLSVCLGCHRAFHDADQIVRQQFGMAVRRRVDVLDYLDGKLGPDAAGVFLERVYPL